MRENRGEIALAKEHKLPKLVTLEEIHGDLQMHTDASDGKATLTEMIDAARAFRSEEHTSELQSLAYLVCRLLLEKKKKQAETAPVARAFRNSTGAAPLHAT